MKMNTFLSIIISNVNWWSEHFNQKTKSSWIKTKHNKTHLSLCCLQETHFRGKVRGWIKIYYANGNDKKAGVTILVPDKADFKNKAYSQRQRRALHYDK